MGLISIVVVLIVIGFLMYAINTVIPMEPKYRQLVNIIVLLFVLIWLLQQFGLIHALR